MSQPANLGQVVVGPTQQFAPVFNARGKAVLALLSKVAPEPVLLLGNAGWGKSILARAAAQQQQQPFVGVNFHPGLDISVLVGLWRPEPVPGGISITWQDGVLTQALRRGDVFLGEELTRAPQDALGRLFGLLDTSNRYWPLPEAGISEVSVHPRFWFIATANPVASGYSTERLDRALLARFAVVVPINDAVADERAVAVALVGEQAAPCLLKFVKALRVARVVCTTRELVHTGRLLRKGLTPGDVATAVFGERVDSLSTVIAAAEAHLG